jgi:low temperature requirement protein LtrA
MELFFDLIFVAAVTEVAEPLREHYSLAEVGRLAPLFVLICWAWKGQAVFATRFGSDAASERVLTLVQMFAVAALAPNAREALDSESTAGFVAAYGALRLLLVGEYARARRIAEARPLATRYLIGDGAAALVWLASALAPPPGRFVLWMAAAVVDLAVPWLAVDAWVKAPPHPAHLPERLGLFLLILLGDAVIAVMQGMESQDTWTPAGATCAFLGMGTLFLLWWWYFDGVAGASPQPVVSRRDALRLHAWSYAHLPLYLGIIVTGVGLGRLVTSASRVALEPTEPIILAGALGVVMAALTGVGFASPGGRVRTRGEWATHFSLAGVTLLIGTLGVRSPVLLVVTLAGLTTAQLAGSLVRPQLWPALPRVPSPRAQARGGQP